MHAMRMHDKKHKDGKGAVRKENEYCVKMGSHQRKRDEMREKRTSAVLAHLTALYKEVGT